MSIFVSYCPCIGEKRQKNARKIPEKSYKKYARQKTLGSRRGPPPAEAHPGGWSCPLVAWYKGGTPQASLCHIDSPRFENHQRAPRHAIFSTVPPSPRFRSRDRQEKLSRHHVG